MFDAMLRRQIPIVLNDLVSEKAILTREGKSNSAFVFENVYRGTHPGVSVIASGDLISDGESYFLVQTVRKTPDRDKSSMLLRCNQTVDIKRLEQGLDVNLNPINDWVVTFTCRVSAEYVTGVLWEKEPGLLANTILRILMQKTPAFTSYNDSASDLAVDDRISLGPSNYQITAIDAVIMPGLLMVQVSTDTRQ